VKAAISPKVAVSIVFVSSMFMNIMDGTVVNVALPTLSRSFHVPLASVSAAVTAYLVALAVAMPASGWLGDRFGAKAVMICSLALFTLASALCGMAMSLPELVALRTLQGVGSGVFVPVGMAMMFRTFPPAERIRANRYLMVPTLLAPASGPVIGGALVTGLSWRWIFYINVPIGLAVLAFGLLCMPGGSEHPAGRFDLPGFALAAVGFPLFMYAVSTGATAGWDSPAVTGTGVPGALLLAVFIVTERRATDPMLRLRIISDRLFRITSLQLTVASAGFMGTLFLAPLMLQNGLGFSALHSGLSTFTEALGGMAGVQVSTRLYKRAGPRRLITGGMGGTVATIGGMALAGPSSASWLIPALMFLTGSCFGFAMAPSQTANMATVTAADTGHASTLLNTMRQAGAAAGVALLGTVLAVSHAGRGDLAGFRVSFLSAALLMLAGAVFAAFVRDSDAIATMRDGGPDEPLAGTLAEAA
jgi:EmrB/QacA subfamily drug resistance transporter